MPLQRAKILADFVVRRRREQGGLILLLFTSHLWGGRSVAARSARRIGWGAGFTLPRRSSMKIHLGALLGALILVPSSGFAAPAQMHACALLTAGENARPVRGPCRRFPEKNSPH